MEKKFILIFVLVLLALPLIFPQTYQLKREIYLKIPFIVNGSIASSSATCNVSVDYPNSTYLKQNVSATNLNNGDFSVNILPIELIELGEYDWRAFCCDGSNCAAGYGSFEVTATGEELTTAKGIIYVLLTVIVFFLFLFVLYVNIALPMGNEKNNRGEISKIIKKKYIKIGLIPVTYTLFIWFLNLLLSISIDLIGKFDVYYNMFSFLFSSLLSLSWAVWVSCLVWVMFVWIRDLHWNKQIKKFGRVFK